MLPRTGQWSGAIVGFVITSLGLWVYGIGSLCCLDQAGAYLGSCGFLIFGSFFYDLNFTSKKKTHSKTKRNEMK
jgi:hypothetical protein